MTLDEWLQAQSPLKYAEAIGKNCLIAYRSAIAEALPHVNDSKIKALINAHLVATENEECLCEECYLRGI